MDSVKSNIEATPLQSKVVGRIASLSFAQSSPVMRSIELPNLDAEPPPASPFQPEALEVLDSLRLSIASALSDIGDFSKPADVYKTLKLDRTLARQLFRLASTAESVRSGGMIPSGTSIDRFLSAAEAQGVGQERIKNVRDAYAAFENLVQTHAGDRATFNSMVSAAGGVDESWHATDLQHRRNAFRAMSHSVGVQAKSRLMLTIVNENASRGTYDAVVLGGFIGLRILRPLATVRVVGIRTYPDGSPQDTSDSSCGPLGLSAAGAGYVLEEFSSTPLPSLRVCESFTDHGLSQEIALVNPVVGNAGSSNLMFGTLFRRLQATPGKPMKIYAAGTKPVETLLLDMLTPPDWQRGEHPSGKAVLGASDTSSPEIVELQGNFKVEYLGQGPRALSTPEVPRYTEMLAATDARLGWKLDTYNAWRLRLEFPIYQSTISIEWPAATDL